MQNGDGNSYVSDSGNSYTWINNQITVTDSFNQTHSNSHNGHGRGGWCGIVALLFLVGIPVAVLWIVFSALVEVLQ